MDAEGVRGGTPTILAVRLFHEDGYDLAAIAGESMAEQLIDCAHDARACTAWA